MVQILHGLFVSGLPSGCDEATVRAVFGPYGAIKSVKMLENKPGKPEGAAIVDMENPEQAKWLIDNVNGKVPQGLAAPITIKKKWSGGGGGGKGFGKGYIPPWAMMQMMKYMKGEGKGSWGFGLSNFSADKKVWIGGLPTEDSQITYKELQAHFPGSKFAAVLKGNGA